MVKPILLAHIAPRPPPPALVSFPPALRVDDRGKPWGDFGLEAEGTRAFLPPELGTGDTTAAPRVAASKGGAAQLLIAPSFPGYVRASGNQNLPPRLPLLHRDSRAGLASVRRAKLSAPYGCRGIPTIREPALPGARV